MTSLEKIEIYKNQFTGTISPLVSKLSNLTWFLIHDNKFNGTLPDVDVVASLPKLEYVYLQYNNLIGNATNFCKKNGLNINADCLDDDETGVEIDCKCCRYCCGGRICKNAKK